MGPFGGRHQPGRSFDSVSPGTFARMNHSSAPRHWDGSPASSRRRRSLRVEPDSPPRLLRCAQHGRCRECGNLVEWYHRVCDRPIPLHPRELPSIEVPVAYRWHVSSGLAHPAGDGSAWCRLTHAVVCPARDAPSATTSGLTGLRRALAVNTRRRADAGAFVPPAALDRRSRSQGTCRPARPIVQILYIRYLAARPLDEIQCVAQTRHRARCTVKMLTPDSLQGIWTLVPATAAQGQLALPTEVMAMYDLSSLRSRSRCQIWRRAGRRCHRRAHGPGQEGLPPRREPPPPGTDLPSRLPGASSLC